ncbi:MAG: hypothetical protein AAB796_01365 [Patescibacteria group bacterium]
MYKYRDLMPFTTKSGIAVSDHMNHIRFTLPLLADGRAGKDWIPRLKGRDVSIDDEAKYMLRSPNFKPTKGVSIDVAILKGRYLVDNNQIIKNVHAEAKKCKWSKPNADLVCLILENFTEEEIEVMDLRDIVAMHEPFNDSDDDPPLLSTFVFYRDGRWLHAYRSRPHIGWHFERGFAFVVSQSGSQS